MKKLSWLDSKKRTGSSYFYWLAIVSILSMSCSNKKNNVNYKKWDFDQAYTLTYKYTTAFDGITLQLFRDSTFRYREYLNHSCGGDFKNITVLGMYQIDKDYLTLKPDSIILLTISDKFGSILYHLEDRNVKPKPDINVLYSKYGADSCNINTKYKNITWGSKSYLLSEEFYSGCELGEKNDYMRLAYDYNRETDLNNNNMGNLFLEKSYVDKDTMSYPLDLDQIPSRWRYLFQIDPISVKVIHKTTKSYQGMKYWIVELNKGKNDSTKIGMELYTKHKGEVLGIDSLTSNRSYGTVYSKNNDLPIGTIFKTKWK